jgi:hypothetical protein
MVTQVISNTQNQLTTPLYTGTGVTCSVTFANPVVNTPIVNWPAVDPTTVLFTYQTNGSTTVWQYEVDEQVTRISTGVYQVELDTTALPGQWQVKWQGTGACAAVWASSFFVSPSPI